MLGFRATWLVAIGIALGTFLFSPASILAAPTPCTDLSITGFTVDPPFPIAGTTANVKITVTNSGCSTEAFVVQWKSDRFAQTGPSQQVQGLGGEASTTLTFPFAFPKDGNFLTLVNIDTDNTVGETNEVNNLEILPVTVLPATVDLTITSFKVDDAANPGENPVRGRPARATIVVKNLGNTAADEFIVQWKPSPLAQPLTKQVNNLAPGASTTVTLDFSYVAQGTMNSTARVDKTGLIKETNETNNSASTQVIVEPPLPDLVITNLVANPAPAVQGSPTNVKVTVKNIGNDPAGAFRVEWKPNPLTAPLAQQVNSLAVGASTDVSFDYTYQFPGSMKSTASVDTQNRVAEVNEDNNDFQYQILVGQATVDLVITSTTIAPGTPTQGETAQVNIVVKNQGNTRAEQFVVSWNPDTTGLIVPSVTTLTKQVEGLNPGQSTTVNFPFSYQQFGNFRTLASVDAFNNVMDTNEANNLDILNLTVNPAPIDLIITSFSLNPASPVRASDVTATITVKNNGPFPANNTAVQWKLHDDDNGGPLSFINGLNPGESRTVTLQSAYFGAGTFTTLAIVDPFNTVVEPGAGESNNTKSLSVTVQKRQTAVRITMNNLTAIDGKEDGIDGNGEYDPMFFAVLKTGSSCSAFGQTIQNIACQQFSKDDVEDGDTFGGPRSIDVTLIELSPLVAAVTGLSDNSPLAPEFLGLAPLIRFAPSTNETVSVDGVQGKCGNGKCFRVSYTITILSAPPPLALAATTPSALSVEDQATLDALTNAAKNAPAGAGPEK